MQSTLRRFTYLMIILVGLLAGLLFAGNARAIAESTPQAPDRTVTGQVRLGAGGEAGVIVEAFTFQGALIASATTNAQGHYSLDVGDNSLFRVRPRKGVFEFNLPSALRFTQEQSVTQDFVMFRLPIVIQGGYTPLSLPQTSCPQRRLDGSTYNPGACGEVAFANLLRDLRGAGWNVRTVMMNSSILGTPALATQTSALRRAINDAKQATGASKVILFAHSTGGPVARRYIESTLYANDVAHLFTFGSQHLGNPVEDVAEVWFSEVLPTYLRATRIVPDFLISALVAVIQVTIRDKVNFLCSTSLFQFTIPPFGPTISIPGPGQRILCETSISGMANFNLAFQPRAGVGYHLVHAANVRSDDMNMLGLAMTAAIPGLDDTLIQTRSTTNFAINGPHDRLVTRDPHMTETSVGNRYYLNTNGAFDSAYVACIRPMFITRTLSASNCGTVSAADTVVAAASAEATALLANLGVAAGEATEQKTRLRTALLMDTATVVTHTVQVIESGSAIFLTNWLTGSITFTVATPDNGLITAASMLEDVEFRSDATRASYIFSATQPGAYTMQIQATDVPTTGIGLSYQAALESAYVLTTERSRNWLPPGGVITITAVFTGPTSIDDAQVVAYVSGSNDVTATVTLTDLGSGLYRYLYIAPDSPGYIEMEIVATGGVGGVAIERNDNLAFTIYPDSFAPNGEFVETVGPLGVTIDVGIDAAQSVSGDLRVTGILAADGEDVAVATAEANVPAIAGAQSGAAVIVPLYFDGRSLYEAGKNGPFVLRRLLVVDEREHALVSADELNIFTTSAIDVSQFASALFLPLVTR